jgi:hypothetical protein
MIWGRIYAEKSKIYMQSYLRFLRRGSAESLSVTLTSAAGESLVLEAKLPAQAMSMQLHTVTRNDLEKVVNAFQTNLVIRDAPDETSTGTALAIRPARPFSYSVVETKGDWMRIHSTTGIDGWVKARAEDRNWGLRKLMPELSYLDGVVGYLRLRDQTESKAAASTRTIEWIERDFREYEAAVGKDSAPLPLGIDRMLRGVLLWDQVPAANSVQSRKEAASLFAEALKLIPDYAASHNLAAITQPFLHEDGPTVTVTPQVQRQLDSGLLDSLAIEARNRSALDNLAKLYEFASANASSPPLYENIKRRLDVVRDIRATVVPR